MIEGYAAVFDSRSEDLGFFEVIAPGAFDRALREKHDVRALVEHDAARIIGRTKSGTLKLSVDGKGLLAKIDQADTQAGRDVTTSLERGDLDGMSFAFRTLDDTWRDEGGELVREVRDVELVDVSVVAIPAYSATTVAFHRSSARGPRSPLPPGRPLELDARGRPVDRSLLERGRERARARPPLVRRADVWRLRLRLSRP